MTTKTKSHMRRRVIRLGVLTSAAALLSAALFTLPSCGRTHERRNPVGEPFPTVTGTGLDDKQWTIPDDLAGEPALLLVGYKQSSQFDIDRWLLGMRQVEINVRALEIPTIPGFFGRIFGRSIDSGMRSGIPQEDWGAVVTVYADGSRIASFTGNRNGLPARVLLLDADGEVRFFHDEGYSVGALERMSHTLDTLRSQSDND